VSFIKSSRKRHPEESILEMRELGIGLFSSYSVMRKLLVQESMNTAEVRWCCI
jgi:hypothetical protein